MTITCVLLSIGPGPESFFFSFHLLTTYIGNTLDNIVIDITLYSTVQKYCIFTGTYPKRYLYSHLPQGVFFFVSFRFYSYNIL